LSTKYEKIKNRIQNGEFRYLIKRVFPRGNFIFYWGSQLVFKLTDVKKFDQLFSIIKKKCDHDIQIVDHNLLEQLCNDFPQKAEKFKKRIDKGYRCYVSLSKGKISAYLWVLEPSKNYFDTNSLWKFKPDQSNGIWCFDGFVKPEHRMIGLFPYLMGAIRDEYLNKGYVTQYGETDNNNDMSLNTHLRVGYTIFWRVFLLSIFGLKIYFARNESTGQRKIDFRYAIKIDDLVL